jgi:hypothetical protein
VTDLPPIADPAVFAATRAALHALAEQVLAAARFRVTGRIGLRATPGGFATPVFGDAEEIRVDGTELVVTRDGRTARHGLTTLRAAAEAVGIEPGAPPDVYPPATTLEPDAALAVDAAAAAALAAWFGLGTSLLEALRATAGAADAASDVQLWPEHFDLGIELGDDDSHQRATFGTSPGDAQHPLPYLYVTRWPGVPDDAFWNDEAFPGASVDYATLAAAIDAEIMGREFFAAARAVLTRRSA